MKAVSGIWTTNLTSWFWGDLFSNVLVTNVLAKREDIWEATCKLKGVNTAALLTSLGWRLKLGSTSAVNDLVLAYSVRIRRKARLYKCDCIFAAHPGSFSKEMSSHRILENTQNRNNYFAKHKLLVPVEAQGYVTNYANSSCGFVDAFCLNVQRDMRNSERDSHLLLVERNTNFVAR